MYKLLPQIKYQVLDCSFYETTSTTAIPSSAFLCDIVFAGDSFRALEAAYGRIDGVVKTITGYCGGTLRKPTYMEVCEGRTGHTEAVKITYDKRKVSYRSLCNAFWETHDPTKKDFLNFGISTHHRSVIFYATEDEKKQAQESKIRKQMKLNKRIVTKIMQFEGDFYIAENLHQKYYLQKHYRLCESLSLRSTDHFVQSHIACQLNGILAMDAELIIDTMTIFLKNHDELSKQSRSTCEEIIEDLKRNIKGNT